MDYHMASFLLAGLLFLFLPFSGQALPAPKTFCAPSLDFTKTAKKVLPSVVSLSTEQPFDENTQLSDSALSEIQAPKVQSLGAGFFIDKEGYLLTNNHVLNNEEEATVRLFDESLCQAKVIAKDKKTDIALLKLTEKKDVIPVQFADKKTLQIGNWVLAAGNPFGLGTSVTAGIISALSRDIKTGPYDDFIQIDASLSQGNSGGPLFDLDGNLIGMNTALFSLNKSESSRIGFAIPVDMIKKVAFDLKRYGFVRRGFLGVSFKDLDLSTRTLLKAPLKGGVLITAIEHNSPAYQAGIKPKDILLSFNQIPVLNSRQFAHLVANTEPQKPILVDLLKNKKHETKELLLTSLHEKTSYRPFPKLNVKKSVYIPLFQGTLTTAEESLLLKFNLNPKTNGALIVDLPSSSKLAAHGVRAGDIIIAINEYEVKSMEDVVYLLKTFRHKKIAFLLDGVGGLRYLTLTPERNRKKSIENEN
ncbi:MAG: PDZ domain-containing protein [Alphaproteobacteria bacterium]|nr:PDZ domain-containing protein [Alphaproteobacteria bacterium]